MSDFDYTAAARRVVTTERDRINRDRDYDALAAHYAITTATPSADVTAAAHAIVIDGEAANGRTVTDDAMKGRNPGDDAPNLTVWRLARAVRIGLVDAAKRAAGTDADDADDTKAPDYLALAVEAAKRARDNGGMAADDIVSAIAAGLA